MFSNSMSDETRLTDYATNKISSLDEYYSYRYKIVEVGKDFSKIKLNQNRLIIKNIWNYVLETSKSYCEILEWNNLNDNEDLPKIMLSMNPNIQSGYVQESNNIKYNFFAFFFNSDLDKYQVIFYPPVLQIGRLLHEFDHYLYCKSNDLIYTRRKCNDNEAESRALKRELRFLEDFIGNHNENKYWAVKYGQFKEIYYNVDYFIRKRISICKNGICYLKYHLYNNSEAEKLDTDYINKITSSLNINECNVNKICNKYIQFPFKNES